MWYQNIRSVSFTFVTIQVSDGQTDRQTDRQNGESNTVHCIKCSRTVKKTKKSLFKPPFRGFRSNVRTLPMARWKYHGRLYIHCNRTYFAISYSWDVTSRNPSMSAFFRRGGSLSVNIWNGRGRLPFRVVSKYPQSVIWYCHNTRIWQTDGQMELREQYRALHYMQLHGKN